MLTVKEFVDLVNSMECEEFSDVPESNVEFVRSRVDEQWSFDETYSTSMNVYKCSDGYAGVRGVCHLDTEYFKHFPSELRNLPNCEAFEVVEKQISTFAHI